MPAVDGREHADSIRLMAGDIGGTKVRIGIFAVRSGRPRAIAEETFSSRDAEGLEEIVEAMLSRHPAPVNAACFGIAGPVFSGKAEATNLPWAVSEEGLRKRFGWEKVRLINDLAATALAVPHLDPADLKPLNTAAVDLRQPVALIAPGTGLGMALLIRHRGEYRALASEGGHADFAPTDEDDVDLWRHLREEFGHVSLERLVSGPGLVNLYRGLLAVGGFEERPATREAMARTDPARVIADRAAGDADPLCRAALERFCKILGAAAGNLALTGMTTGGVFLGGGIPPKILPFLEASGFMTAFTAKGRFSGLCAAIGVRVVMEQGAALLGAACHGLNLLGSGKEE